MDVHQLATTVGDRKGRALEYVIFGRCGNSEHIDRHPFAYQARSMFFQGGQGSWIFQGVQQQVRRGVAVVDGGAEVRNPVHRIVPGI